MAGAFLANEIMFTILTLCHVSFGYKLLAGLTAVLVGVISEIRDMIYEFDYEFKTQKHIADIMSWIISSGFWLACKVVQNYSVL
jgi:hypothetical protein